MARLSRHPLPPPPRLFRLFEGGAISREQLHEAMREHQRAILEEMAQARLNPVACYLEHLRNRSMAARLAKRHGEAAVREVLGALGEVAEFPPANLLWNAGHWDVPLHCFFRTRREPLFRVVSMETARTGASVSVAHGSARRGAAMRESFELRRNWLGELVVESRQVLG
jgi:hypothetical protein